ncbi:hypothetical protein B0T17DRAFT_619897 [Bombardia bombarda]|uniref:Protein kinase domain-containing protein n=1 Tax=Bombardia bombarda TaxID=252184 RepID=A0AA39WGS7_9PEZI|nr:hypothetical protein B0T17DRAFT_619897 [Bombardia bombarda]
MPVFKVGDFGLAEPLKEVRTNSHGIVVNDFQDAENLWNCRRTGKEGWYTPEQFSEEWNNFDQLPTDRHHTAGRYGWKSNLYQLAQVMMCIATGHRTRWGTYAERPPAEYLPAGFNPASKRRDDQYKYFSFGAFLLNNPDRWRFIDWTLREWIMKCMYDQPRERPGFDDIRTAIEEKKATFTDEDRRAARLWADQAFGPLPEDPHLETLSNLHTVSGLYLFPLCGSEPLSLMNRGHGKEAEEEEEKEMDEA